MMIPLFNQCFDPSIHAEWLGLLRQSGESVGGLRLRSDAGPVVGRSMRTQQKQQKTRDFSSFSWGKIENKGLRKSAFIASFLCWKKIHQDHLCDRSSKIRCSFTRPTGAVSNKGASGGSSWQRKIENKDKSMMKFAMIPSWISHTQEKTHGIQTMFIHFGTETTCHLPAFGFIIGPMEHMEWLQWLQWLVKKVQCDHFGSVLMMFLVILVMPPAEVRTKSQVAGAKLCLRHEMVAALDSSSHGFKSMGCNE